MAAAPGPPSPPYHGLAPNPPPSLHILPQTGHFLISPIISGIILAPQNGQGSVIHAYRANADV